MYPFLKYALRCLNVKFYIDHVQSRCCGENSDLTQQCPNTMKQFRNRATNKLCKEDGSLDPEWFGADTRGNFMLCHCSMVFSSCEYALAKANQSNDQQFKKAMSRDCCTDALQKDCSKEKKKFDELFPQACQVHKSSIGFLIKMFL